MAEELNQKKHERLKQLRVLRQDASDGVLEEKHAFSFSFWRCCNDVFMFLSYLFWEDSFPNYSRENVFKKCHFSTWVITMCKVCQNIQPFWLLPNLWDRIEKDKRLQGVWIASILLNNHWLPALQLPPTSLLTLQIPMDNKLPSMCIFWHAERSLSHHQRLYHLCHRKHHYKELEP